MMTSHSKIIRRLQPLIAFMALSRSLKSGVKSIVGEYAEMDILTLQENQEGQVLMEGQIRRSINMLNAPFKLSGKIEYKDFMKFSNVVYSNR